MILIRSLIVSMAIAWCSSNVLYAMQKQRELNQVYTRDSCGLYCEAKDNKKMPCGLSLMCNARRGIWLQVTHMLKGGNWSPFVVDGGGRSLLHYARKEPQWVKDLLRELPLTDADMVGSTAKWGKEPKKYNTPQIARVAWYYPQRVRTCIARGANPNALGREYALHTDGSDNSYRETPILYCLRKIKSYKEHDYMRCRSDNNTRYLEQRGEQRALEGIQALVQAGAFINKVNGEVQDVLTPLSKAIDDGRSLSFIEELLKLGACPNAKLPGGHTVLSYLIHKRASMQAPYDIIRLLIKYGASVNASGHIVFDAACEYSGDLLRFVLPHGLLSDGFGRDAYGRTLFEAAMDSFSDRFERMQRITWLLDLGFRASGCALYNAACAGHIDIVGLLLAYGCSPQLVVKPREWSHGNIKHFTESDSVKNLFEKHVQAYDSAIKNKPIRCFIHGKRRHEQEFLHTAERVRTLFAHSSSYKRCIRAVNEIYQKTPRFTDEPDAICACDAPRESYEAISIRKASTDSSYTHELFCCLLKGGSSTSRIPCAMEECLKEACPNQTLMCELSRLYIGVVRTLHDMPAHVRTRTIQYIKKYPADAIFMRHPRWHGECLDILQEIIQLPVECASRKCHQSCGADLFEHVILSKPSSWQPSWRHIQAAIEADELGHAYVEKLVEGKDINRYGPHGQTPLLALLTRKMINMQDVRALLKEKANPNLPDLAYGGNRALHHVVLAGDFVFSNEKDREELINLLLAHGADIHQPNMYGETPADSVQCKK